MRAEIAAFFEARQDEYISGEQLSEVFQVSRTAIWKHIRQLKLQGYEFESTTGKGYRLTARPQRLDMHEIMQALHSSRFHHIQYMPTVDSTQTPIHRLALEGAEEGTIVLAEEQTGGRGRMGRSWHSPAGKGLWFTMLLRPNISLPFTPQLTLLCAVALASAIERTCPVKVGIKWPNDLLIDGKKVSGILLESSAEDERLRYIAAGIGISVNLQMEDFDPALRERATSLRMASGAIVKREELFVAFIRSFEQYYALYLHNGFEPIRLLWEAMSITLGKEIDVRTAGSVRRVQALSLDASGALVVKNESGQEERLFSGEVRLLDEHHAAGNGQD